MTSYNPWTTAPYFGGGQAQKLQNWNSAQPAPMMNTPYTPGGQGGGLNVDAIARMLMRGQQGGDTGQQQAPATFPIGQSGPSNQQFDQFTRGAPASGDVSTPTTLPPGIGAASNATPNQYVSRGFGALSDAAPPTSIPWGAVPTAPSNSQPSNSQPASMVSAPDIPLPAPRPADAPQNLGFFQRNAFLQRDPESGAYLDPTLAARAIGYGRD